MNITREEKKIEAIKRMKSLGIFEPTIQLFAFEDFISISESPLGALYWANEQDLQLIRQFEEATNTLVYLVIRNFTGFGKLDSYLFVSDYYVEWERDRRLLKAGMPLCYVHNHDDPTCSEFSGIVIERTTAEGLRRTW